MKPKCEVDFTCNGDVQCKECDWRGSYGTSCFAWTDAEKIAALLDELKELGVEPLVWKPIEEAPYDETIVVFCEKDASIYRDVIYDQDIQDYKKKTGVTHFMKFTIPGE